mmetsp:Transcript_22540/g.47715  ORF Transcript_22540/g.47715 Transcript_22540/m.47715 type:complete len:304 (-) Transcript_22540:134-1045(-)|eukprot:CAMPEP_0201239938 /NCGR_PEP_ID=MMETSP0852-20130820/27366_1 /ASSEMBLY_ACC=CAM_ASM_000632 /TAXON_ID=183588 /ORGANISM="Pseudo-nitzschia fraudulenta, Strain WWA7" /LENGTH=303 /DNA_ID=CAMNT_0047535563 /DNA_START=405 /DNA_END=1316 /DNA_ORIENTATION=-
MEEQEYSGILANSPCDPVATFGCLVTSGRRNKEITYLVDMLPATVHCNNNSKRWDWNDSLLSRYWAPEDGVTRNDRDYGIHNSDDLQSQSHHLTYGEVTPLGVRQLTYEMGIAKCDVREDRKGPVGNDKNDEKNGIVFYDLGSGVGRLVTQIYMDQPDRVAKAIGVELAEERHAIGAVALGGIMEDQFEVESFHETYEQNKGIKDAGTMIPATPFPVQLIHGDATEVDLDSATTHVFISSLCFPEDVLRSIQKKLLRLPNIRVVAALNHLDLIHQLSGKEWEERDVPIEMTWGPGLATIYNKI